MVASDYKKLVAINDELVRQVIKQMPQICYTCNSTKDLGVGHYHKRALLLTRWHLDNVRPQCLNCNSKGGLDGNLVVYAFRLATEIGDSRMRELNKLAELSKQITKLTDLDLENYRRKIEA